MTAEVAVLNREAVAIAADSAVTFGAPERDERKIYNTANKIFVLSETEPVALMIYASGSFGTIPWETVVKEYRRASRGTQTKVKEYADDFLAFLRTLVPQFSEYHQRQTVVDVVEGELGNLAFSVDVEAGRMSESDSGPSADGMLHVLLELAANRLETLGSLEFVEGLTEELAAAEIAAAIESWEGLVGRHFPDLPVDEQATDALHRLALASVRCAAGSSRASGLAFTGFGTDELFPTLSHYCVDGVIAGHVRCRHLESVSISEDTPAEICAFAQQDMVLTFMRGMDPGHQAEVYRFFDETVRSLLDRFGNLARPHMDTARHRAVVDELRKQVDELSVFWREKLNEFVQDRTTAPIMSIVALLPKEELAELAEALVNLTSFKRRVTPTAETVGGPVDVAVISRGDGLVWLKRKHYFPPELNPRYFRRLGFEVPGSVTTDREQS